MTQHKTNVSFKHEVYTTITEGTAYPTVTYDHGEPSFPIDIDGKRGGISMTVEGAKLLVVRLTALLKSVETAGFAHEAAVALIEGVAHEDI